MSHFSVHRRLLYCYFLITTITLFGIFHARIDEWSDKRNEKTFIEHFNFVLNVEPNASVTTHDAMECAIECIKRNFCFSFNFAVYSGNNNCKLLRENKYTSSDKFHASPLYYHYSIVVSRIISDKTHVTRLYVDLNVQSRKGEEGVHFLGQCSIMYLIKFPTTFFL